MKKVLFIVMCVAVCACSQNKKNAQEALLEDIHQTYVESTKYQGVVLESPSKDTQTLDLYIKKGEEITDMTVLSEDSRCVQVVFNNYERVYNIFFPKGEKILTWGTEAIRTSERVLMLNLIYEK